MPGLDDLPPELACQILENLSIGDIFAARSASRALLRFVDRHVEMVAYGLARRDFPRARLLLRPTARRSDSGVVYDLDWLRALVPRRLAAVALDRHRVHRQHTASSYTLCIPAEDDFGDELRARLAGAWCVLQRIGHAYRDVYGLREEAEAEVIAAEAPIATTTVVEAREALVYERALALIEGLEPHQCEAFCLLAYLLLSAFEDSSLPSGHASWRKYLTFHAAQEHEPPHFLDCRPRLRSVREPPRGRLSSVLNPSSEPRFRDVVVDSRHPDRGNAWAWSFLFREGADAFRRQWIDGDPGHVAGRMARQWSARSPAQIHAERECSSRIWYAMVMRSRATTPATTTAATTPGKPQPQPQQQPLTPPPDYDSLRNPSNDYAFPAIDRWFLLRRRARAEAPSKSMLAWHLWQEGLLDINAECGALEDWMTKEEAAELLDNNDLTDSLKDLPYRVCI